MSAGSTNEHNEVASSPGSDLVSRAGGGTHVWLARHAEVAHEWQGKAYGNLDVPLSPEGEVRTRDLATELARLRPERVLSSPLDRARRLGEAVAAEAPAPLQLADDLAEIHRGRWQGLAVHELHEQAARSVAEFYADPWSYRGHGGEADEDVARRAWRALAEPLAASLRCLVVTTHYNVIRVLCATALGIPAARSFALRVDPGRAVLIEDSPGGWRLHHSNVSSPLAATARDAGAGPEGAGGAA